MTSSLFPGAAGPAPKAFHRGTHRTLDPEETVTQAMRWMPVLGITRIAPVTGLDRIGIPVVMAVRPNARSLSVSQGKGATLAAAKASGLMEAAELFHAERIDKPLRLASWADLRLNRRVIDVAALPRLAASPFHPHLQILWLEGWDLLSGHAAWVPFEMVHTNYTLPLPQGSGCFVMSSNGLASGNHPYEALCHALCELIERDATTLWLAGGEEARRRTRLDLASVDDPLCQEILARYDRAGVLAGVWEITSDLGVAAYYCSVLDRELNPWRPLASSFGAGCHPDRGIALLRALTEAAQSRLTLISSSRDDLSRERYRNGSLLERLERAHGEISSQSPRRSFQDAPHHDGATFEEDLAWLLDRLASGGFREAVAVDLSLPGLGLPVVRVLVPGLEPSHEIPGYLPGERARAALASHPARTA